MNALFLSQPPKDSLRLYKHEKMSERELLTSSSITLDLHLFKITTKNIIAYETTKLITLNSVDDILAMAH